jgi:hypothetical protein
VTTTKLEELIKERFAAAGLAESLDEEQEQYLEFPDGFFAELVLKDASELARAKRVVRAAREELEKQGIELNAIVRPRWEYRGVASIVQGANPLVFRATLQSGKRSQQVTVNVTRPAYELIRKRVMDRVGGTEDDVISEALRVVSSFLHAELSRGGEAYWDPLEDPERELNEEALMYVYGERAGKK